MDHRLWTIKKDMTYPETLDYLYAQLPMFTRVGSSAFKKDLTNTLALCQVLGNPHEQFKTIHVGGTNGKGSTSHMLAAVLQTAGYKTGLYTSPHLRDFRERIRINGEMIPEQAVVDFVDEHRHNFEEIEPSFFEMTVALAFDFFAREKVDIAVIEVGLGGRLDSTNIITPLLSVITNIGWDHMNMLGDTLPLIAAEKAGIIKPGIPVIIGEYQPEVADVFITKARLENAPISFASELLEAGSENKEARGENQEAGSERAEARNAKYLELGLRNKNSPELQALNYQLDLNGSYQTKNVKSVLSAVDQLRLQGYAITDGDVQSALRQVKALTGLRGRWDTLSDSPLVICDTGHNPEGIAEVLKNIAATPHQQLRFVMGMVNDKDSSKVLGMLPQNAIYYFCKPDIPRGLDAETLKLKAESFGLHGNAYSSVQAAFQSAKAAAQKNDLVFIGGSTFVVAEVV
ncbi:bifunctional folylpolyglutamate synthase/dihydrofolate synthase [Mucilaginibacter paludis]|uniref:Dihydrofolate synthase/folylpolyglutamate synthase n=1 Tax=Mucilaginibacter paludis DSM 18603 TaxID=714943 RepID=H1XZD2_9SPHI|nr:folylpolyglutamate synthase/dihydrofolate synthase family protein [Mucilaginibacter paludis]EHQ25620.1 FolC bifunctional protein [Mucilaginibacter paludis DSM 18603]